MGGGLRVLVNPASTVSEVDIDGTSAERRAINEAIRRQAADAGERLVIVVIPNDEQVSA